MSKTGFRFGIIAGLIFLSVHAGSAAETTRVRVVDHGGYADYDGAWAQDIIRRQGTVYNVDCDGDGSADDDYVAFNAFSFSEPLNPPFPYWNTYRPSMIFYGGVVTFYHNIRKSADEKPGYVPVATTGCDLQGVSRGKTDIHYEWHVPKQFRKRPGIGLRFYHLCFWKKEDFLSGGDKVPVVFDETSRLRLHITRDFKYIDEGRWVVQDGDTFYISEATFQPERTGHVFFKPVTSRWAVYTPTEPYDIAFPAPIPPTYINFESKKVQRDPEELPSEEELATFSKKFSEHTFTDIQAVGFYMAKNDPAFSELHFSTGDFLCEATLLRAPRYSETFDMALLETDVGTIAVAEDPVDFEHYRRVLEWGMDNCYAADSFGGMGTRDQETHSGSDPVSCVSAFDALVWCNALSAMENRTPCYYLDEQYTQPLKYFKYPLDRNHHTHGSGMNPDAPVVYFNPSSDGFRLPLASEYLKAASGGVQMKAAPPGSWEWVWNNGTLMRLNPEEGYWLAGGDAEAAGRKTRQEAFLGERNINFRIVRTLPGQRVATAPVGAEKTEEAVLLRKVKDETRRAAKPTVEIPVVKLPEGAYRRDDGRTIELSSFYVGTHEVTFRQWECVYDWAVRNGYSFERLGDIGSAALDNGEHSADEPVTSITWYDCLLWCNALSEMEGRTPCYYTDDARTEVFRSYKYRLVQYMTMREYKRELEWNSPRIYARWHVDGYRLPTAAEWSYAALGGATTKWHWGECFDNADEYLWHAGNSDRRTHLIGQKKPNGYGLYDMVGNVSERCWDMRPWPQYRYYTADLVNPKGTPMKGIRSPNCVWHKSRGGSFAFSNPLGFTPLSKFTDFHFSQTNMTVLRNFIVDGVWDLGFRIVRCDAGVHPEEQYFVMQLPITIDPEKNLQGVCYRGNTLRSGFLPGKSISGTPRVVWQKKLDGAATASPIISEGNLVIGDDQSQLYVLDAESGAEKRKISLSSKINSTPALDNGIAYVPLFNWEVAAYDLTSGSLKWRMRTPLGRPENPCLAYDHLFLTTGFGLVIINRETGEMLYETKANREAAGFVVYDGVMIVGAGTTVCDILSATDIFKGKTFSQNVGSVSFDPKSRTAYTFYADHYSASILPEKTVAKEGNVVTLATRWLTRTDKQPARTPSAFAIADGKIYGARRDGVIQCLDAETGEELWHFETKVFIEYSPIVAGGVCHIGTSEGSVLALDADSGKLLWEYRMPAPIIGTVWVVDGMVYAASTDGTLVALR